MKAEIITIGDELLIGQTIDTNSAWLGQTLGAVGIQISRKTAVSDSKEAIFNALDSSLNQVSLVIITGGLGPTRDDITKHSLVEYFGGSYRTDEAVLAHLEELFAKRGRKMMEVNKMQAELPERCQTLFNKVGTAPGMWFEDQRGIVISLPGVPNEVQWITQHEIIPRIQNRFDLKTIEHRTLLCLETPESLLSKHLENFEDRLPASYSLAYLPQFNSIRLRLSQIIQGVESDLGMEHWFQELRNELGSLCFGIGDKTASEFVAEFAMKRQFQLAGAESCTGGYTTNQLIQVPGMSAAIPGSIIAYSNQVKVNVLGVNPQSLQAHGAVSMEVGLEMAKGALGIFDSHFAFSLTGIAGPSGGSIEKPVGTVVLTLISTVKPNNNEGIIEVEGLYIHQKMKQIPGNRIQFMQRASNSVFALFQPWF
jgi:nicotinamide-nucleotide amidase